MPYDEATGSPLDENILEKEYPNIYNYLMKNKVDLSKRIWF